MVQPPAARFSDHLAAHILLSPGGGHQSQMSSPMRQPGGGGLGRYVDDPDNAFSSNLGHHGRRNTSRIPKPIGLGTSGDIKVLWRRGSGIGCHVTQARGHHDGHARHDTMCFPGCLRWFRWCGHHGLLNLVGITSLVKENDLKKQKKKRRKEDQNLRRQAEASL